MNPKQGKALSGQEFLQHLAELAQNAHTPSPEEIAQRDAAITAVAKLLPDLLIFQISTDEEPTSEE